MKNSVFELKYYPKVSIVTPCYNLAVYLEQTIKSVVDQGYPNLEYIIIDGGSTDGTLEIIKKYEDRLAYWVSEPDNGMYEAINKGFAKATGEIMGWINADDILHTRSLFVLERCFRNPDVKWVQGLNTVIDEEGVVIATSKPLNTTLYDFMCYRYLKNDTQMISFGTIQQESTYWRRELWEKAGGLDLSYQLAGDFKLWMLFFRYEKLYLVDSLIGAFRKRRDQLSVRNLEGYIAESRRAIEETYCDLNINDRKLIARFKNYRSVKNRLLKRLIQIFDVEFKKFERGQIDKKSSYIQL